MKTIITRLSLFIFILAAMFVLTNALSSSSKLGKQIILAHNLDELHPVHQGMLFFAKEVGVRTNNRYQVKVYANGQLGREREVIELLQLGAVSMTKVSSMSLESFVAHYSALNLPYIFRSKEHYFNVLDGEVGQKIHKLGVTKKFRGLTYYDSGARSFYTNKPIMTPSDLEGLKIRVMGSQTAIEMMKLLGGSPTPMSYGEIYTALQQNVIDGAENNITALTLSRHGEVAKHYSLDEHIMAPDVLIISEKVWASLSNADQVIFKESAESSAKYQRDLWKKMTNVMKVNAQEKMNVKFYYPEKDAFISKVLPLHEKVAQKDPLYAEIIEAIKKQ